MASEEMDEVYAIPSQYPRGKYLLVFDPLDGSSNVDVNISVGTIFSILTLPRSPARRQPIEDFLQPGTQQVCAGYALYGSSTMLVLTIGHGVNGFTLDRDVGEFVLTHPNMKHPRRHQGIRDQRLQPAFLGKTGTALRRRVPGRQDRSARQGLQHALGRLDGRRSAPHPHPRRHLHVSQGHQGSRQGRQAAPAV